MKISQLVVVGAAAFAAAVSSVSIAQPTTGQFSTRQALTQPERSAESFQRLIIKFKEPAATRAGVFDFRAAREQISGVASTVVSKTANANAQGLTYLKSVSDFTHVATTSTPLNRAEMFALAKQLEKDPQVEYAEIDELAYPTFVPNDPAYAASQWHYQSSATYPGGINLPAAWDSATGTGVVVAVVDTGYRPHADLAANLLPGYDFVSDVTMANDGDARDSDASDPGDWNTNAVNCTVRNSSWHGTHVAGTIAAVTNNGIGGAGVAFNAKVLPVRVLGVCGGYSSDIAAGMRWAAGLSVSGVPDNLPANRAKVLNLSLGGAGACGSTYQDAITAVRAVGTVVVVATGNNSNKSTISSPANCTGVIAVTAHTKLGDNASYANTGAGTTISAPGGGTGTMVTGDGAPVYSTLNAGTTIPGADSYAGYQGTSMATPHVAGVAALLFSLQPGLTPDQISSVLTSSARAFPTGTYCAGKTVCGAGLLDAKAAIDHMAHTVSASVVQSGVRPTGSTVNLTSTVTPGLSGNTSFSYVWAQTAGATVSLSGGTTATPSFVAPVPGGSYSFKVTVTDGNGLQASNTVSVTTNTAPTLAAVADKSASPGGSLSFSVTATDPENDTVTYVAAGLPAGATFNAASGLFAWNPVGSLGTYTFTVTPYDSHSAAGALQTITVQVTNTPSATAASGGGGGGSLSSVDLVVLCLLAVLATVFGRIRKILP